LTKDVEVPSTQTDRWQDSVMIWGAIGFDGNKDNKTKHAKRAKNYCRL